MEGLTPTAQTEHSVLSDLSTLDLSVGQKYRAAEEPITQKTPLRKHTFTCITVRDITAREAVY